MDTITTEVEYRDAPRGTTFFQILKVEREGVYTTIRNCKTLKKAQDFKANYLKYIGQPGKIIISMVARVPGGWQSFPVDEG